MFRQPCYNPDGPNIRREYNSRTTMLNPSNDNGQTLPPRPLRPDERELVAEWLAAAGDVASAYVSTRGGDDLEIYGRIVITVVGGGEPSYLIDTPAGTDLWIVVQCLPELHAHQFGTLREALNFVRPVLCQSIEWGRADVHAQVPPMNRVADGGQEVSDVCSVSVATNESRQYQEGMAAAFCGVDAI